jgi:hypothetical protein
VRASFIAFHDSVAELRVVHRDVNLREERPDLRGPRKRISGENRP